METADQAKLIKKECLRLLTRREHSRKEIEQKLLHKGFASDLISAVLNNLIMKDWQDDTRFAESYARQRRRKGFGPVRIAYELQQRGIEAQAIAEITQSADSEWIAQMEQVCMKKYNKPAEMTRDERAKCQRFLLQRGFSSAMINAFFKQSTQQST